MIALLLGLVLLGAPVGDDGSLAVTTIELPAEGAELYLRDADGDGDLDLLRVDEDGVHVRLLDADGTYGEGDDDHLPWPAEQLGWHLVDVDADGATDVALLVGGREVVVHRIDTDGHFDEGRSLLEDGLGALPRGRRRVPFMRDVDGDGTPDAVVPGAGAYRIHLLGAEPRQLSVSMDAKVAYRVGDPSNLDAAFSQEVTIPLFRIEDIDGDGTDDLVAETEDQVLFHLGLSAEPSWRIDLAALRDELGEQPLDLDNLLARVTNRVTWRVVDVDGVPPRDLIISQAGTFRVWNGGAVGDIERPPDLLLKSSGNVLHYLVRDVTGDGRGDLQIIRGDVISLGQVARLLVVPGALDFDVFTYPNEGGRFARRPARRSTVRLEIPRLMAFYEELEEMQDELEARFRTPAARLCLDGDGRFDDVVDVLGGEARFLRDVVPADWKDTVVERVKDTSLDGLLETFLLRDLDRMDDGAVRTIALADIRKLRLTPGWELRQATRELEPWLTLHTPFEGLVPPISNPPTIEVVDLDRDGRSDVLLRGELLTGPEVVQLIVVRPAAGR